MSRTAPKLLRELRSDEGYIGIRCPKCAHEVCYAVHDVVELFVIMRWRDDWDAMEHRFRCGHCGRKPVRAWFALGRIPLGHARPVTCYVPAGVDKRAFIKADDRERKRLIRLARG